MLLDQHLIMSDRQEIRETAPSTHTVDQGAKGDAHNRLIAVCKVDEAFAGITEFNVCLQSSPEAGFSQAKSLINATFSAADLVQDKSLFKTVLPLGSERYLRGYYTVTGTGTAGKVSLFITDEVDM